MKPLRILLVILVGWGTGFALNPVPLKAQSAPNDAPATWGISSNVLGLATLNPTLDVEYSLNRSLTLGTTIWWELREVQDRWAELKFTYYPSGTMMRNFGIALTGGFHTAWKEEDAKPEILNHETSPTLGILVSYSWRFLENKRLVLTPVIGSKKPFSADFSISPLMKLYPEFRVNVGYVF